MRTVEKSESLLRKRAHLRWNNAGLLASGALALVLGAWRLADVGYANRYYAAAVKSMASNPHAWFFASLDPSGFVSIDKPPVGFWIQALSVWIFGFSPLALLLPQVIAGALAPPLLGVFLRRSFPSGVAVTAAFALALTPVWMVAARDNIVDVPLALTLLLAAGALLKAIAASASLTRANTRMRWNDVAWLTLAFALVGVGFNIKMLEAYLIVPALAGTYLVCARRPLPQRFAALLLALLVLAGLSLSWVTAVDLAPATARPYVGSTATNSEFDLAFGYNGLKRLLGKNIAAGESIQFAEPAPSQRIGEPGPLRLLQPELGSQVSWLAPLALLGLLVAWPFTLPSRWPLLRRRASQRMPNGRPGEPAGEPAGDSADDPANRRLRQAAYVLFTSWLLTGVVFFSIARSIDTYYLVIIAPALSALAGIGVAPLWSKGATARWRRTLVPGAILATLCEQAYLMTHAAPHWAGWPIWLVGGLGAVGALALLITWAAAEIRGRSQRRNLDTNYRGASSTEATGPAPSRLEQGICLALLLICFVTPGLWTVSSLTPGNSSSHPIAGPTYAHEGSHAVVGVDAKMMAYLRAQRNGAFYLVGTRDSGASTALILTTSDPVMTLGGFSGNDPILTPDTLRQLIVTNQVRLFLLPANYVTAKERATLYAQIHHGKKGTLRGPKYKRGNSLDHWIATHCAPVPPPDWSSAHNAKTSLGTLELFNCAGVH